MPKSIACRVPSRSGWDYWQRVQPCQRFNCHTFQSPSFKSLRNILTQPPLSELFNCAPHYCPRSQPLRRSFVSPEFPKSVSDDIRPTGSRCLLAGSPLIRIPLGGLVISQWITRLGIWLSLFDTDARVWLSLPYSEPSPLYPFPPHPTRSLAVALLPCSRFCLLRLPPTCSFRPFTRPLYYTALHCTALHLLPASTFHIHCTPPRVNAQCRCQSVLVPVP